jgi:NTE family protein
MSRALVLGGGGVAGIAWELGILLGLQEAGVDVTAAERLIGTSAGSAVAAQVASGVPLAELYERQASGEAAKHEIAADFDPDSMMMTLGSILAKVVPGTAMQRAVGRYALHAKTVPEAARREVIAARLPMPRWPDRDLSIAAIDAGSGRFRVFTAADGIELVDAVAASCAVPGIWPAVSIEGRRYIDGGMRSTSNADLAAGSDPILIVAPMPELPMVAAPVKQAIARVADDARVLTINADEDATAAMGSNPLDPATAVPAAEAGRRQAAAHVAAVAALWDTANR